MNVLKISFWILLGLGIILFIPSWGGSLIIVGVSIVFILTQLILIKKPAKTKNIVGIVYWFLIGIYLFNYYRTIVLEVNGTPEMVYVLTDIPNTPEIHSYWKLKKRIKVDSSNVVMTSSSWKQVGENFNVYDQDGKNIGDRGLVRRMNFCENGGILISVQTKYLDFERQIDTAEFRKSIEFQQKLREQCKTGS